MDMNCIIDIGIVVIAFIILFRLAKFFIAKSNSNSIIWEGKMLSQSYITLIMGGLIILLTYMSYKIVDALEIIFLGLIAFAVFNFFQFLFTFLNQIKDLLLYRRTSSLWLAVLSFFIKNVVILYLIYKYYNIAM